MLKIRSAQTTDLTAFYGETRPRAATRAMVVEDDGDILLVAGVVLQSPLYAFMDMKDEMRNHPRVLIKGIARFREILESYSVPVLAKANPGEKNAAKYLKRVGFEGLAETSEGRLFVWRP